MYMNRALAGGIIGFLAFAVSACGSATSSTRDARLETSDLTEITVPEVREAEGTGGQLIPIDSDNVAQAGYSAATGTMTVQFDQGRLYEYYGVPLDLWERFVAAQPDPWSIVGYPELVQGGYAYQEVTP